MHLSIPNIFVPCTSLYNMCSQPDHAGCFNEYTLKKEPHPTFKRNGLCQPQWHSDGPTNASDRHGRRFWIPASLGFVVDRVSTSRRWGKRWVGSFLWFVTSSHRIRTHTHIYIYICNASIVTVCCPTATSQVDQKKLSKGQFEVAQPLHRKSPVGFLVLWT